MTASKLTMTLGPVLLAMLAMEGWIAAPSVVGPATGAIDFKRNPAAVRKLLQTLGEQTEFLMQSVWRSSGLFASFADLRLIEHRSTTFPYQQIMAPTHAI